ncbi:MAG: heparan-alpha-glucosaminide N-acetyltransferase domain-containing protein [Myxococcota bacterium]
MADSGQPQPGFAADDHLVLSRALGDRVQAIDVARGFAMSLVFFSHFSRHYYYVVGAVELHEALRWLTRVSTPAFVLLSGMMLGLLRHERRADFSNTRDKLIDRGLFLLIVCHPLIALAEIPVALGAGQPWYEPLIHQVFITDTIAIALILGALVAQRCGLRDRALLGASILVLHWLCEVVSAPSGHSLLLALREVLSGRLSEPALAYGFPILPWFAVYLLGSGLGESFARWRERGNPSKQSAIALRFGLASIAFVVLLKATLQPLKAVQSGAPDWIHRVLRLGSVAEKLPPSVAFVAFYGGVALIGISSCMAAEVVDHSRGRSLGTVRRWTVLVGRNSLVAFVLQFYVYYTLVYLLPKPPLWTSPAYFAGTFLLLLAALKFCDTHRLNAYFSVGYARTLRKRRERLQAALTIQRSAE